MRYLVILLIFFALCMGCGSQTASEIDTEIHEKAQAQSKTQMQMEASRDLVVQALEAELQAIKAEYGKLGRYVHRSREQNKIKQAQAGAVAVRRNAKEGAFLQASKAWNKAENAWANNETKKAQAWEAAAQAWERLSEQYLKEKWEELNEEYLEEEWEFQEDLYFY